MRTIPRTSMRKTIHRTLVEPEYQLRLVHPINLIEDVNPTYWFRLLHAPTMYDVAVMPDDQFYILDGMLVYQVAYKEAVPLLITTPITLEWLLGR